MENLEDFVDESFFKNSSDSDTDGDEDNVALFLKHTLDRSKLSVQFVTKELANQQKFVDDMLESMERENKIVSEIDLVLKAMLAVTSTWKRFWNGNWILGIDVNNTSDCTVKNVKLVLGSTTGCVDFRTRLVYLSHSEQASAALVNVPEIAARTSACVLAHVISCGEISVPVELHGIILYEHNGCQRQTVAPVWQLSPLQSIYKKNTPQFTHPDNIIDDILSVVASSVHMEMPFYEDVFEKYSFNVFKRDLVEIGFTELQVPLDSFMWLADDEISIPVLLHFRRNDTMQSGKCTIEIFTRTELELQNLIAYLEKKIGPKLKRLPDDTENYATVLWYSV